MFQDEMKYAEKLQQLEQDHASILLTKFVCKYNI